MNNIEKIHGVNKDLDLIARLSAIWAQEQPEYTMGWNTWRRKLLTGKLRHANPVQLNAEIMRKRRQAEKLSYSRLNTAEKC